MQTTRPWAFWRRVQYGAGFAAFWITLFSLVYVVYFTTPATCFDGVQNGDERGVDCGGACARICAFDVATPQVEWARSFEVTEGQYNAVAYVENRNRNAATPELPYTMKLYDGNGLITERSGTTILPPDSVYPIFEARINTDGRVPTQTIFELGTADMWVPAERGREQFTVNSRRLLGADNDPRLEADLYNTELEAAEDVEIVATIFDSRGNALTASRTFVDDFAGRSTQSVVFTWPNPIATTVRSCEVPSDVMLVLDRSGSMAADGGDPPEPLESAKQAAQRFVSQLQDRDQVGFLSYATTPSSPFEQTLTQNKQQAAVAISGTVMGEDGIQYTNMGAAFAEAASELSSSRHRDDARKVIIFMTDGDVTRPLNPETGERDVEYAANFAREAAAEAKAAGIMVYTIGFGDFFGELDDAIDRDVQLIVDLASEPRMYYEAPTVADLNRVYQEIASDICEDGAAVIDIVPKTDMLFTPLR